MADEAALSGSLEEIDGTPIEVPGRERRRGGSGASWARAVGLATATAGTGPKLWAFALVAFLARGGVVLLASPIIVLPSFIAITAFVGPTSVTAAGPTPRLIALAVGAVALLVGAIVAGTAIAAAAEIALYRAMAGLATATGDERRMGASAPNTPGPKASSATADSAAGGVPGAAADGPAPAARGGPATAATGAGNGRPATAATGAGLSHVAGAATSGAFATRDVRGEVARIVAIRLGLLLPIVIATLVAVPAYVAAGYRELSLPSDLGVPLAVRVVAGAPEATVALAIAWLAGEVVGGLAARRVVLGGTGAVRALALAVADLVRRPVASLLTLAVVVAGSAATVGPALFAAAVLAGRLQATMLGRHDLLALVLAAVTLAAAWTGLLLVAGITAAWRAALWTAYLGRRAAARR